MLKFLLSVFFASTLVSGSLDAKPLSKTRNRNGQGPIKKCNTARVIIKELPPEETATIIELRREEMEELKDIELARQEAGLEEKCYGGPETIWTMDSHTLIDKSPSGMTLTIEDGTVFEIIDEDSGICNSWKKEDKISIRPSDHPAFYIPFFMRDTSSFQFKLVNLRQGGAIRAKLSLGPLLNDPNSRYIYDMKFNMISLNDGSVWKIPNTAANINILSRWMRGDYIIVGTRDPWLCPRYILINVGANNWISADQ